MDIESCMDDPIDPAAMASVLLIMTRTMVTNMWKSLDVVDDGSEAIKRFNRPLSDTERDEIVRRTLTGSGNAALDSALELLNKESK